MLMDRDNSSALLVVTMAITMLSTAATDAERAVLFSLLAQASTEIPEVVAMM
jgi:neurofibromin 1